MDPHKHLVPPRDRLFHLLDPNDIGWAVPGVNRCPHERRLPSGKGLELDSVLIAAPAAIISDIKQAARHPGTRFQICGECGPR
ncbi:hypothetical protein ACFPJ1_30750 [Kribbella qitaiheensis]|uniref:hypothetical protein n=1 Tax=Kribbella qitaiheensis TaxID=1544730 RepID=UPI003616D75F